MMRKLLAVTFVITMFLMSVGLNQAHAAQTTWTGSGSGAITFTDGIANSPNFDYSLNPAGFSLVTWNYHTTADITGVVNLDYSYSGYHAFFAVTVLLRAYVTHNGVTTYYPLVSDGPVNCCTAPSGGFSYTGSQALNVKAGDEYGFEFGGSNGDSDNRLIGTLAVTSSGVVAPATVPTINEWGMIIFILLAGLGAAYYLRRQGRAES